MVVCAGIVSGERLVRRSRWRPHNCRPPRNNEGLVGCFGSLLNIPLANLGRIQASAAALRLQRDLWWDACSIVLPLRVHCIPLHARCQPESLPPHVQTATVLLVPMQAIYTPMRAFTTLMCRTTIPPASHADNRPQIAHISRLRVVCPAGIRSGSLCFAH